MFTHLWTCNEHFSTRRALTRFISCDGELIAGLALADQVLSEHADVVGGGGVQVDDGGLVELRRHVLGDLGRQPRRWGGRGAQRSRGKVKLASDGCSTLTGM